MPPTDADQVNMGHCFLAKPSSEVEASPVSVHILDATTQVELAALKNIPIDISI
jgi:hypothetical protein